VHERVMNDFFLAIQSNIIFELSLMLFHINWDFIFQDFLWNSIVLLKFVQEQCLCNHSYQGC